MVKESLETLSVTIFTGGPFILSLFPIACIPGTSGEVGSWLRAPFAIPGLVGSELITWCTHALNRYAGCCSHLS